ncbi:MAG: glutathione S-transferase family protein [Gammaproteobacteria bacterium]
MSTAPVHVFGHGTGRTIRVYWALHELDLPYVQHPVRTRTADMEDPAFLAVSPGRKVPAIEHEGLRLVESAAIVDYLFRLAGRAPSDLASIAMVEQWTSFALMELDATALYVMRRHRGLPQVYGESPVANAAAAAYFERQIGVVAEAFADGRPFVAGDDFSKADICLGSCCDWALLYELELPGKVMDYLERLRARPGYGAAWQANFRTTPGAA